MTTATALPKPMLAIAMTKNPVVGGGVAAHHAWVAKQLAPFENDGYRLEVKYDGIRWIVRKSGLDVAAFSRPSTEHPHGLPKTIPPKLREAILRLPDGVYDGEFVTPGGRSWNVSRLDTEKRLVLFDVLEVLGEPTTGRPYTERRDILVMCVQHYGGPLLYVSSGYPVSMQAVLDIWAHGGEGAIVKRVDSTYQPGRRSPDWVKVKQLHHLTVTITGFDRGKAASSTPWSVTLFKTDDGRDGRVGTLDNATVAAIAKDPAAWVGRRLVIYYTELTESGSFRHGGWDHLAGEGE